MTLTWQFWENLEVQMCTGGTGQRVMQGCLARHCCGYRWWIVSTCHRAAAMDNWRLHSQTSIKSQEPVKPQVVRATKVHTRASCLGLWGIYSLLHFMDKHQTTLGQVLIACDGLTTLCKVKAQWLTEPNKANCYNLNSAICKLRFQHMKGHQDFGQLLFCSTSMDEYWDGWACKTKSVLGRMPQTTEGITIWGLICSIRGKWVIKNLTLTLQKHLNGPIF